MNDHQYTQEVESSKESSINLRETFLFALSYWLWFVASVIVCLLVAWLYIQYTPPSYNISATVMIKDEKKGGNTGSELMAFKDMEMFTSNSSFDNEIEVLRSKSLIEQVVFELKTYVNYSIEDGFKLIDIYGKSPIIVEMSANENSRMIGSVSLEIKQLADTAIYVSGVWINAGDETPFEQQLNRFPGIINTPAGNLVFSINKNVSPLPDKTIFVSVSSVTNVARSLQKKITIEPTSKTTSVVRINVKDINKQRGENVVNKLVEMYNRITNNDKNRIGIKTEEFIKTRIEKISEELDTTEYALESYKRETGLMDVKQDASFYFQESSEYEQKRTEVETQLNLISHLSNFVNDKKNEGTTIPISIELSDNTLVALINTYNDQIRDKSRLMRVSSENNPAIQRLDKSIESLLDNVKQSINSAMEGLLIRQRDLDLQAGKFSDLVASAPGQERIITNILRQQEIKSGLYLMLLQKREENSIAIAATVDNAKIIDAASADNTPVSPKKGIIMLVALMIGVILPAGVLYLLNLMRYKIGNSTDVAKLTTAPMLGDLPYSESKNGPFVIKINENNHMTEAFRSLRTNLQFMLTGDDKKVILVTSTKPGEGKTFVAMNLALSLSLLNKKVLLMGMDIRKPQLSKHLRRENHDEKIGMTSYLSGSITDVCSLISHSIEVPTLDAIFAGPIPPNPAELLANDRLEDAMKILREQYDYIIFDTAPVELVTDTLVLERVVDASIYVCRSEYTHKSDLKITEGLYKDGRLRNVSIVVNAIKWKSKRYGYGSYGHGSYGLYGKYGKYQ